MTRIAAALVFSLVVAAGVAAALDQDFFGGRREPMPDATANQPYDGKLTFVRLRYTMGFYGRRGFEPPWAHDYPTADTHMMKILNELSLVRPRMDGSNILALDDPALLSLAAQVTAEVDEGLTAAFPKKQGAEVVVKLKDGRTLSRRLEDVIPADIPLIRRRFEEAATAAVGVANAKALAAEVDALDRSADVGALMRLAMPAKA